MSEIALQLICKLKQVKLGDEQILQFIEQCYQPFFDINNWKVLLSSGTDWVIILSLALIECLLSVDNAIVLAAQTKKIPDKKSQSKALFYGMWGAYIFRFILIGIGIVLIKFWFIKILGAIYLLYLSVKHFLKLHQESTSNELQQNQPKDEHPVKTSAKLFWKTVCSIELMDVVFSIDSVLASLAVAKNPVIILIGGMIGILCMRTVATLIMKLMEKIPELETMAYVLIALIAIKLFLSIPAIDIEIPNILFGVIVFGAVIITVIIHYLKVKESDK